MSAPRDLLAPYRCPRTRRALAFFGDEATVEGEGVRYTIEDGVPLFVEHRVPEPRALARLVELLPDVAALGWRRVVTEVLGEGSRELDYVLHERFRPLLDLLPLGPDVRALEVGASFGQQTVALAPRVGTLHALELLAAQAKLARARAVGEGCTNVHVAVGGDDGRLPYADASFDLVVLSQVLEWCAAHRTEPHAVIAARLLGELHRVLAPGGTLFVSTKNRFALHLLLGARDEHLAHLRFGSALPRGLARVLLALFGVSRASGRLESYGSLARVLRTAGFSAIDPWLALPEMQRPLRYVHADARSIREAQRSLPHAELGATKLYRAVLPHVPVSWVKWLSPGLVVLARR